MLRRTGRAGLYCWISIILLAAGGRAQAQARPSSDLLLPYFDVGLTDAGTTTLLTVSNALDKPVSALATLSSNWGVPVLSIPLKLQAHQILTVDLRDWLAAGKVPGVTLSASDLLHLQAALSGQPSPRDGLYYSTATAPDHAVGAIAIRTLGDRPQALQGQFYLIDPSHSSSQAQNLDDIAAVAAPAELCAQHVVRQIAGGAPGVSQVILWTDTAGLALPSPSPQDRRLQVTVSAYSAAGSLLRRQTVRLLPVARISAADLGLTQSLGRLEIATGNNSVATVRAGGSAVFTSACGQGPPPAPQPKVQIVTLINGQHATSPPGPSIAVGVPIVWQYMVSNAGSGNLTQVRVSDSVAGAVKCPQRLLKPGQSMTCTRSGLSEGCQHTNVATVSATGVRNTPVSAQDSASYFGDDGAAVEIMVSTNGQDADTPPGPSVQTGSAVSWTYLVVNTGTVRLYQISVRDDQGVAVSCPRVSLGPGEDMSCTASGVAVPGQYSNVGKVTATGTCAKVTASNGSHYFGESSLGLKVQALTNGYDANLPPGPSIPVGNPVTWQYVVTNTGKLTVNDISVSDDHDVAVSCPLSMLQPGQSMTCVARSVAASCQYGNFGTATGQTSQGPVSASDASHYVGQGQAALDVQTYANGQSAGQPPGPAIATGTPVQWSYGVTNTGQVALTAVKVTDDRVTAVSCPQSSLQPGQSMTCTATSTAVSGYYTGRGIASGTTSCNSAVTATGATNYVGGGDPGIQLQTLVNGQNANTPPGPSIAVGGAIAWSYVVSNTGPIPLTNVAVSDSLDSFITCPQTSLQPGASMTCASPGTAQACQASNFAKATAKTPGGQSITAIDPAYYVGQPQASLRIQLTTNGVHASAAPGPMVQTGSTVTWIYTVTNTGDINLTQVQVSDDQGANVICPATTTLAPGESIRCTAQGTAVEGQFQNTATATGTPPCGIQVSAQDSGFYTGGGDGSIELQKRTNGQLTPTPTGLQIALGAPVTWKYTVKNTGKVSLSSVGVTDNRGVSVICPRSTLQPGDSMDCTGTGTAQACQYDNLGIATGQTANGQRVTGVAQGFYFGIIEPAVTLQLGVNGQTAPTAPGPTIPVGSTVAWSYLVTNTGNVPLTAVRISDGHLTSVTCPLTSLQPGEQMTCAAVSTAAEGQFDDTASVTVTPPCGDPVTAQDSGHYLGQGTPGLQIQTLLNGQDVPQAPGPSLTVGTPILWSYTVSNVGQASLSGIAVTDDHGSNVTCQRTSLQPGESTACTATNRDNAQACQQINLGKATAQSPTGAISAFDASFYVGQLTAALQMVLTVNGMRATAAPGPTLNVGADVTWTYKVTNLGNVSLSNVKVLDDQGAAVICPQAPATLDPGKSMTCTASGKVAAGQFHNVGSVTADPPCGSQVSAQDSSYYFGGQAAQIQITKLLNGQHVTSATNAPNLSPGTPIAWTYIVRNPGSEALSVAVGDNRGIAVTCPQSVLQPGGSMTCTGSSVAQVCDYQNTGTATGVSPGGITATASDNSYYRGQSHPGIAIKTYVVVNGANVDADLPPGPTLNIGDPVQWSYVVTNTGDVKLTGVGVTDDGTSKVTVTCPPKTTLLPGEAMTCTAGSLVVAGSYHNTGKATATPDCAGSSATVSAEDSSYYFGGMKQIEITKLLNGNHVTKPEDGPKLSPGTPITWSYVVRNPGSQALTVAVVDDQGVAVSCPKSSLLPGDSMVCAGSSFAHVCDYTNKGTATGVTSDGSLVTASDNSYYKGQSHPGIAIKTYVVVNGVNVDADLPPGPTLHVGDTVRWSYVVTNTGDVELTGVGVTGTGYNDIGVLSFPVACPPKTTLVPGEAMTCTTAGTVLTGLFQNTGTATGKPDCGSGTSMSVSASDSSYYDGEPAQIKITKLLNGNHITSKTDAPQLSPGTPIAWSYIVGNTGSLALTVAVIDDHGVLVTCPQSVLQPGGSMTCTGSSVAQACDYENVGTATGVTLGGKTVTDTDYSFYKGQSHPEIAIKTYIVVNGTNDDADLPPGPTLNVGDPVHWNYVVTNTGDVQLSDIKVEDDDHGGTNGATGLSCPKDTLIPGATMTCTAFGMVVKGTHQNTDTATGKPLCGSGSSAKVSAQDSSYYLGKEPQIQITKLLNGQHVDKSPGPALSPGTPIAWSYIVSNPGSLALKSIVVGDNQGVAVTCPQSALQPGDSMVCTGSSVAQQLCGSDHYENTGTATGATPDGGTVTASDNSYYKNTQSTENGSIAVRTDLAYAATNSFTSADSPPGLPVSTLVPGLNVVRFRHTVTNNGNVSLKNLKLSDALGGTGGCVLPATLSPSQVFVCIYDYPASSTGQQNNVGNASGDSICSGTTYSASDNGYFLVN
ncbi:MAG: hypothetical protein ACJ76N_24180 [Thermoanaerobaculia bacterium]